MDSISFEVNGEKFKVGHEVRSTTMLVDYLRNTLELRGTKYMCREGGCGACIVTVVKSPGAQPIAVNSCLVSIPSCDGWEITTVEKVGNKLDGYHDLQKKLAELNGTQCGHCTPGWIMSMYSLLQQKQDLTMLDIEKSFGSNICRCTGYRPILEAYKTFAKDAPDALVDIEDISTCNQNNKNCNKQIENDDWCFLCKADVNAPAVIEITLEDDKLWYTVSKISDIFDILSETGDDSYMLVSGNTAKGAYPILDYPRVLIDISKITELKGSYVDQNLIIGAGNTLTEFLAICKDKGKQEYFGYLNQFYDHLELVAHIPVRNLGTIAGNLMIKHEHNEFPSDIFLLLETVEATITIVSRKDKEQVSQMVSPQEFLKLDVRSKVITNVIIPPLGDDCKIVTFKIMPRAQNAHAIVNAGFFYKLKNNTNVVKTRLVFGGLSPSFLRAYETEKYLVEKSLFTNDTLQGALKVLENDLVVIDLPPEPSKEYRKKLALGLFYKGLLTIYPDDSLAPQYKSGVRDLLKTRPVSEARQIYDTDPALWPLNKPMAKVEALIQCSGEAKFTEDLPTIPREVFAEFVLTTVPNGKIENIDPEKALNTAGVLAFYSAKDIPGLNSFTPDDILLYPSNEELLCNGEVKYWGQPLGIIVAESRDVAEYAAKIVEVKYSGETKPIIHLKEAKEDEKRLKLFLTKPAVDPGIDILIKELSGENYIGEQYHMCMETLVCVTLPTEQGLEVHAATQWLDAVQLMISRALNMDINSIDVYVTRLGGGYGMKISRATQSAVACSLVAKKLNRPCRLIQTITTNMRAVGKRFPCLTEYKVKVNLKGEIQYLDYKMYEGNGYMFNETLSLLILDSYYNCYSTLRWNFKGYDVKNDLAKNTWCRSPGTLESISMAELLMEHISHELSLDPIQVRLANLDVIKHGVIIEMLETLKKDSNYDERKSEIEKYNKENKWKKKGFATSVCKWSPTGGLFLEVNISVYHGDGSVAITHGGVDMGQGVNTLAIQICAYTLKIDVNKIKVKGNNTIITPNCYLTGGSLTSCNVGLGVQRCCKLLLAKLEPIRLLLVNPTWEELIKTAYAAEVDLQVHDYVRFTDSKPYNVYGVANAEVEIDVLTGNFETLRVDILQDVGRSVNPDIDIGQVEGAFIMGLGYWTCEHIVYDETTGQILTDRTWSYHVPQARDIPQDFRVTLKKKSFGDVAYLGSKGIGEPPICLSIVIPLAIKRAMMAARLDSGISDWFPLDGPFTTEHICMLSSTNLEDFKFN